MKCTIVGIGLFAAVIAFQPAYAAPSPWVGTADYAAGSNADTQDGQTVGPFDSYDAGPGVVLVQGAGAATVGSSLDAYFQSYVTRHTLNGKPVAASNLDVFGAASGYTGGGDGYELTIAASFTENVTAADSTRTDFSITVGTNTTASPPK